MEQNFNSSRVDINKILTRLGTSNEIYSVLINKIAENCESKGVDARIFFYSTRADWEPPIGARNRLDSTCAHP